MNNILYPKDPGNLIKELHSTGFTGKNVSIAIIDQRLNLEHEEYKNNITFYEEGKEFQDYFNTIKIRNNEPDYHGSLVAGIAVGQTVGVAKNSDLYYFASHNWNPYNKEEPTSEHFNNAIKKVIKLNRSLPKNKKIRFLSCSWGNKNDLFFEERLELFKQAEKEGLMVLGGFFDIIERPNIRYIPIPIDKINNTELAQHIIAIPTMQKTNAFFKGGYEQTENGGSSSTFPYLAGIFSVSLEANPYFVEQENWQKKLMNIALETSTKHNNNRVRLINPIGILEAVAKAK